VQTGRSWARPHRKRKTKSERGNTAVAQEHWDVLLDETQSSNIHIAMSNLQWGEREREREIDVENGYM